MSLLQIMEKCTEMYLFCPDIKFSGQTYQMATPALISTVIPIIPPTTAAHELPAFAPAETKRS